jgi:hypothetical protein
MANLYTKSFGSSGALGYENPAFKISIVAPNDQVQQKQGNPRPNPSNDFLDNVEVGSVVAAKVGKRNIVGRISQVFKNNENDIVYVEITIPSGKTFKVDASRVRDTNPDVDQVPDYMDYHLSSNGMFKESTVLKFKEFSALD